MEYADHFRNGSNLGGASPEDHPIDDVWMVTCPVCEHEQDEADCFLGGLAWATIFRCRFCGAQWSES